MQQMNHALEFHPAPSSACDNPGNVTHCSVAAHRPSLPPPDYAAARKAADAADMTLNALDFAARGWDAETVSSTGSFLPR
jgi:hypothetical protein